MKKIVAGLFCLMAAWAHAGTLPEITVSEAPIEGGGIYTITIFQPPSPPGPIWSITAWGIANPAAAFVETMRTGWTGEVFDPATWDSQLTFETGTPDLPIFLFTSGIEGVSDFDTVFSPGFSQAAVFWNDSYIGNPMVATSSNFVWYDGTRGEATRAGATTTFAVITSSAGDNLLCSVGFELSLPLDCTAITEADADGDSVPDSVDNCTLAENPGQEDTDFDGYGNACDPDLNDDGTVNFLDLSLFANVFLSNDENADFNSDGVVNFIDLIVISELFFQPPGPSAGF